MTDLKAFLWPKSIAVIGASPDESKLGGRLLFSLRRRAFPGPIYPVNPNYDEIQGLEAADYLLSTRKTETYRSVRRVVRAGTRSADLLLTSTRQLEVAGDCQVLLQRLRPGDNH